MLRALCLFAIGMFLMAAVFGPSFPNHNAPAIEKPVRYVDREWAYGPETPATASAARRSGSSPIACVFSVFECTTHVVGLLGLKHSYPSGFE